MRILPLDKTVHNRSKFDCGEPALNNYLKQVSGQHDKKDLSRTYVLISSQNESQIKGYYSLALCKVDLSELPAEQAKKFPTEIYCTLIGRLAVNTQHQGQGFGSSLLIDAIKNAVDSSSLVPTPMIVVNAKNDRVREWYKEFGFTEFPSEPNKLFMPQKEARRSLGEVVHLNCQTRPVLGRGASNGIRLRKCSPTEKKLAVFLIQNHPNFYHRADDFS